MEDQRQSKDGADTHPSMQEKYSGTCMEINGLSYVLELVNVELHRYSYSCCFLFLLNRSFLICLLAFLNLLTVFSSILNIRNYYGCDRGKWG